MRRARTIVLLLLLSLMALASCSRTDFTLTDIQAQPYVKADMTMGLSLYVLIDDPSNSKSASDVQMVLKSPSGNLSWSIEAKRASFERLTYYGSSDICMPKGTMLEKGVWTLDVILKDGRDQKREFEVHYSDPSSALENYASSGEDGVWFDENSNLTVLP